MYVMHNLTPFKDNIYSDATYPIQSFARFPQSLEINMFYK